MAKINKVEKKGKLNKKTLLAPPVTNEFLLNTEPIDPRDLKHDKFLANLQGNILKGHGRDNTVHLFLSFDVAKPTDVKKWIAHFAKEKVTSFKEQLRQRELFKRNKVSGGLFAGVYLTGKFYSDFLAMALDKNAFENGRPFFDGMAARTELEDTYIHLEDIYRQPGKRKDKTDLRPIHAMVLLAHSDVIELNKAAKEICEALEDFDPENDHRETKNPIGQTLTAEYGSAIRNSNGDGLEHFGYVDGISQPLFLKEDMDEYKRNNLSPLVFDPFAPLNLVLVSDPLAPEADKGKAFGSYFVFRKLEQNVRGFKLAEGELGKKIWSSDDDEEKRERAGAMIVGRFEDGTPATISEEEKMISSGIMNNFDYSGVIDGKSEDKGGRCPYHGHIRKTNPRRKEDYEHRMARRGITYGHRNVSTTIENHFVQMPTEGVGLLFMSFQSSIANQFEHIQKEANADHLPGEPKAISGVDLIIGPEKGNRLCAYAKIYDDAGSAEKHDFGNFVTLKGGDYFFAPSLAFLKNLNKG